MTDKKQARKKHQVELEHLFSKNELIPRMRQVFKDYGVEPHLKTLGVHEKFGIDLLVQMALHKRCNLQTLVGMLRKHFNVLQECVNAIDHAVTVGLVTWDENIQMFITMFTIPADVQREIDCFQYPLPMVVEPRKLNTNADTGYLSSGRKGSVILRDNHHEKDVCLDHINKVNRIKYKLNMTTANKVSNSWRNLDKPKEGEEWKDFQKRLKAFDKYNTHAASVMEFLVSEGNEFYITNRYDKRGRIYTQGYYVNPQGTEYSKACVEFFNEEVIT